MTDNEARPGPFRPEPKGRWLFVAPLTVAATQIALSVRLPSGPTQDFSITLSMGWMAALLLAWERRGERQIRARLAWRVVGIGCVVGSTFLLGVSDAYRAYLRPVSLVAGAGIAVAGSELGGLWAHRRELLLLGVPLVNPFPKAFRHLFEPTVVSWTARCATALGRRLGWAIALDGNTIYAPAGAMDVLLGCSGLLTISRLLVLAILVIMLFPTTSRQKWAVLASAAVVGFVVNASRITLLAYEVMRAQESRFDYWHEGAGATAFTVAASAIAGAVWWLLLRSRPHRRTILAT